MILHHIRARLPLSNRLRWRVVAGLTAVALIGVAGVAMVSYLLAARAERATAAQAALNETAVIHQAVADRPFTPQTLAAVLAPTTGVEAIVRDADGDIVAATGALAATNLPDPPAAGAVARARVEDAPVLLTSATLDDGRRLMLVFDQTETRTSLAALRHAVLAACAVVTIVLVVVMAVVTRRILDPVERTAQAARRLARGALGTRLGDDTPHLFADLTGAFDDMAAALEQTVEGLRQLEQRQRRFVADVSHELRTPLQALSTASDLLEPAVPQLSGASRRGAEALVEEVRRLRALVEDLMEISRLDADQGPVTRDTVDVATAVGQMLARRGWSDRVAVDVAEGLSLSTDRRRLDTILANLVGNALVHGAPPVVVRGVATADGMAILEVADHGPGIPPEDRERVFERFAKADPARTRGGGSGLGLAIARDHARALGATLDVAEPSSGAGTVLRLVHPAARPVASGAPEPLRP